MKKYIIKENQYNYLIELKRNRRVYNDIVNEINQYNLYLNESIDLNEAVSDVLKKYLKKGLLSTALISTLLSNNVVSAQDLISAGVPENKIENVQQSTSKYSHEDILKELFDILENRGHERDESMLKNLKLLNDNAKKKITNEISSKIEDLKDMWNYKYNILTTQDKEYNTDRESISQIDKEEIIKVDSAFAQTEVENLERNYKNNSAEIINNEQIKNDFKKIFDGYYQVDEIIIKASSNTLRNTGDFENMTWEEGSLARANTIKNIIKDLDYTLGCGNPIKSIDDSIINIDVSGENGDGTSGPKSPFEVNEKTIKQYKERNIDEKYWKSNAKESPLNNLKDYEKYNNVTVYVKGFVVEETEKIYRNFKYLQMLKIDSGDKKTFKIGFPKLFKGGKPKTFDGGKVGAKECSNPQSAYN